MKKILLILSLVLTFLGVYAKENSNVTLYVNGELVGYNRFGSIEEKDSPAILKDGKTYIELKTLLRRMPYLKYEKEKLSYKEEEYKKIESIEIKGKKYFSIRELADTFGIKINWDAKTKTAMLGQYLNSPLELLKSSGEKINFEKIKASFILPKYFKDNVEIKEIKDAVEFKDKKNLKAGGRLFTISWNKGPISSMVPGVILDYKDGKFLEAYFSSDVQVDTSKKELEESYVKLRKMSFDVLQTYEEIK